MIDKLWKVGMLAGILTIFSSSAQAHDPGLSAVEVRILADRIVAEVSFAPSDLEGIQRACGSVARRIARRETAAARHGQTPPLQPRVAPLTDDRDAGR